MRAHLPPGSVGNRAEVEVQEGASVADVVESMGAPRALVFAVLVDGRQAPIDQPLQEGAEVTLMPPFAGGEGCSARRHPLDHLRLSACKRFAD